MIARWARPIFFAAVATVLAAPIVVVAGVSLNEQRTLTFPPVGFSLDWYGQVFTDPGWRGGLIASLTIALTSAALAVAVAFPIAWFNWRRNALLGRLLQLVGVTPFILPPVITALGFLAYWTTVGAYGLPWTVVISHAMFLVTLPLVTLTLGFSSIDREVVEAATTMGADERTVLTTVILPLLLPYVVSGYAFAFVLSLNEYIVAYMTVGFTVETLPIKIFNALRYGYTPTMAAVSVLFAAIAALVFGLIARFGDLPRLLGAWTGR